MILCLPFLMFQGRAQEAIDLYLQTFPDAELLEIMHHPEGTEIYDPTRLAPGPTHRDEPEGEDIAEEDVATDETDAEAEDRAEQMAETAEANTVPQAAAAGPRFDDTAAMEAVVDWDTTLVATAQLKVGGQVLMIQDSLITRDFDFTPSISIAVVVDTAEEFSRITDGLAEGGTFLMEPGEYDFAANFAWIKDRFGVAWQINQSSGPSGTDGSAADAQSWQAQAPDFS